MHEPTMPSWIILNYPVRVGNKNEKNWGKSLQDLQDTNKWNNIHIMGVPVGIFPSREILLKETMPENFSNLGKYMEILSHEA